MKIRIFLTVLMIGMIMGAIAQNPIITLTFTAVDSSQYVPLDSIHIENLSQGCDTNLYAMDTVIVLGNTGIGYIPNTADNKFSVSQNYPNPFTYSTKVDLYISDDQDVNIYVRDLIGRELSHLTLSLQKGAHSFTIYPGNENIYLLTISGERASKTLKLLNAGSGSAHTSHCTIVHKTDHKKEYIFKTTTFNGFTFSLDDLLRYTGYAIMLNSNPGSDTLEDTPLTNTLYTFNIHEAPIVVPTVITDSATDITSTTATSGGNVLSDGGADVTVRGVCWSTSPDPTTSDNHTEDGDGTGTFVSYLTGLTPDTLYYVRAYATNSAGTAYGNEISFNTLPLALATVTTDTATNITQTTATSGGEVTSDGGAYVTVRGVCWSTSPNPTTSDDHTEDGSGIGTFVSNLTGLTPATLYYVRAYATNSLGTAYGNEISFTTSVFVCGDQIADIDGNLYNTVEIGTQCWMKENLKTTKYNNNTPIPNVTDPTAWIHLTTGAYVWYNNDSTWKDIYGALYNWFTTVNTNNLCPTGWHVPSLAELHDLFSYIGGSGSPHGNELKSCRQVGSPLGGECNTSYHPRWNYDDTHYDTDDYGFSGTPGGHRKRGDGGFTWIGYEGAWWSTTVHADGRAHPLMLRRSWGYANTFQSGKNFGFSVRCLQD